LRDALEWEGAVEDAAQNVPAVQPLVLGIDGGGSKTLVWLAAADGADASPLGVGEAGPSNPQSAGWAAALANLDRAIQGAFAAANRPRGSVVAACLAVAGVGREPDQDRLRAWASQRQLADQIIITHDALPILAAGTSHVAGVALICGTGSLAFGRTPDGRTARAGGMGYLFSDEGSGYDIAREGLRAVALSLDDRGPRTLLVERFLTALGSASSAELVRDVYRRAEDRQWMASLAQIVLAAAADGDEVADQLVHAAARKLAGLIEAVSDRLGEPPRELAFGGGLIVHSELLRARVLSCLKLSAPASLVPQPVAGTIVLARSAARHSEPAAAGAGVSASISR
jgi:N-acetylglucosamine kinase-like BadF-type ATPase